MFRMLFLEAKITSVMPLRLAGFHRWLLTYRRNPINRANDSNQR
jgi:hypothetical protein